MAWPSSGTGKKKCNSTFTCLVRSLLETDPAVFALKPDVRPFVAPVLTRVSGRSHAAAPG